jgi:hypothetical protein
VVEMMPRSDLLAAAAAARAEAQSLRFESIGRRRAAQRTHDAAARRKRRSKSMLGWVEQTRALRYRSAWSDLGWRFPDETLDLVLVPHDGAV